MDGVRRSVRSSRRRRAGAPLFGQLLTAAVESAADAIAIRFDPTGDPATRVELTYREFDEASSRLARELIERGIGPGDVVAVALLRSVESVLAVWAIAKTGAAYVPVDPGYPAERITHMVTDSRAVLGVTISAHRVALGTSLDWIELDDPAVAARVAAQPERPISYTDRVRRLDERHPAYVIYTSGSTGRPKGVVVTHAGLAALAAVGQRYAVTSASRVTHLSSPSFDFSLMELLFTFSAGATLVIAPPTVFGGDELADLLRRERVTHLLITPGALASVDPAGLDELRVVVAGGDKLSAELVERWARDGRAVFNAYGPTEVTVMVTTGQMVSGEPVTLGGAVAGIGAFVLDSRMRPVPSGVVGELYLTGPALAQGYLGRPGLTADRFVASPFGAETGAPGARLYRTGDLVRRDAGGNLEYLGRSDFQVKIRGLRIELGEIDSALAAHRDIDFAATLGRTLPSGVSALVSYVRPRAGAMVDTAELLAGLAESLPAYMVPAAIVVLDEIPLTPVGKLDRAALPEPVFEAREFRAPSTPVQQIVAQVFAALLLAEGTDARVGVDDDFFALGGNSLLAAQAAARIGTALQTRVPVQLVFEAPAVGELADRVARHLGSAGDPLTAQQRPEHIPLSYAQQRMWFLNRFDPASGVNNIPLAVRLAGVLDVVALRAAARDLVARHEVLRTVYPEIDGDGTQLVLPIDDARAVPELPVLAATMAELPELVAAAAVAGFDVVAVPPIRLRLLRISESDHVLVCVVHHIAADGFSMGPLARDLMSAYAERVRGDQPRWQPLEVHYADYAIWQRRVLGAPDDAESLLATQISFWRAELAGLPEQLALPTDRPRPAVLSNRGAVYVFEIDAEIHTALEHIARGHNSTLFMVVHAAFAVLLARLSGTRDIAIGTPVAGRGAAALDDLIGMFVNTLVLRGDIDPTLSFDELLREFRRGDVAAFGHADVPFERLVELLDPVRSMSRHPLFQVLLTFQNMAPTALELPGLAVSGLDLGVTQSKFDLELTVVPNADKGVAGGMAASFTYATDLFDETTVASFAARLTRILAAVVADPHRAVGQIELLTATERQRMLVDWNDTAHQVAPELLLDGYRRAAVRYPDAVAVAFEGTELTYREFDARVNRLARLLIQAGVGAESLVGLAVRRSVELVVGMYAIITAGGAYLPLDPDHPADRIAHILDTARPVCVLTTMSDAVAVPGDTPVVYLDTVALELFSGDAVELSRPVSRNNPAYVIFTSGSTGRPKGVAVSHAAIHNQIEWMLSEYPLGPDDVYLQKTATTFDVSLWGYFMPLRVGAKLVVATHDGHRDPVYLAETIAAQKVTVTDFVPSMLTAFAAHTAPGSCPTLRDVLVIGEALPPETVTALGAVSGTAVHNLYGPTEAAVSVTAWRASAADTVTVPIGLPQWNTRVYVLDSRLRPVPAGVVGELYLAGDQLARGYVGRPDLTADRFVADPLTVGARMYRTGDLVAWRASADAHVLEYLGRSDFQVKFRGQRIELGEIETALQAQPAVSQAAAAVVSTPTGDQLVGYVVPMPRHQVEQRELRSGIAQVLPTYMVPAAVVVLAEFPLNTSGKLDRKALPAPTFSAREFRATITPAQEIVAAVFAEVLGVERVGLDDDFFDLGGNSLLATRVIARINDALDTDVAVRDLFETSAVAALAAGIVPGAGRDATHRLPLTRAERPELVPLSLAQQRMWVLNRIDPRSPAYNLPFAIRLTGALDIAALRRAVEDVLVRHEALRTRFPTAGTGGQPYQEVLSAAEALPGGLRVETATDVSARVGELASEGFDVTEQVPVRVRLLADEAGADHVLVLVVHHISADGASLAPLARDLVTAYLARIGGSAPGWSALPVQYADFALWQRAVIGVDDDANSVAARQLAYWREQLAGLSTAPVLPLDRQRPVTASGRGASVGWTVPAEVHEGLLRIARAHRSSLFMVVHAALAVLLARLSGGSDIAIGTPIAGRGQRALDELVGMFVNTLALRTSVDRASTFDELVEQTRTTDLSAFAHADLPFERVVEAIAPGRGAASRHPLFQVMLSFQNLEQPGLELPGLTVAALDAGDVVAKFDLQVVVEPRRQPDGTPGDLIAVFTYATDLFEESTVHGLGRMLERILAAVVADPGARIGGIDILDAVERDRAVTATAPTEPTRAGTDGTELTHLLTAAVEDDPDAPALVWGEHELSYAELDARSSRLARVLIGYGCGPGTGVAIRLERGVDSAVAAWAVLEVGAALVPVASIDAALPAGSAVRIGLTTGSDPIGGAGVEWLRLDDAATAAVIAAQSPRPVNHAHRTGVLSGGDPALIAASGVRMSYDEVATAADRLRVRTGLTFESRTFRHGRPDTSAALLEVVVAGATGASLIVLPDAELDLGAALADEWVTHLITDDAVLSAIDTTRLTDLRAVVLERGSAAGVAVPGSTELVLLEELLPVGVALRM
ncbi:amino acid adenylation domain-containing protein [Nocardia sp. NBC_00565]|uniref:amino acid adenylation domain-containing protein n=1 Tax=Nocardia sp. NBC_00565 TaxID=2975993 RepID=UPI002E7FFA54|nr:amino acid adenylation domain-containing protein [Nocardia sp. NBC_00565]WUC02775.1 amino acid adenylation domain-containing protein [Nocardia sp. NBC_00565]